MTINSKTQTNTCKWQHQHTQKSNICMINHTITDVQALKHSSNGNVSQPSQPHILFNSVIIILSVNTVKAIKIFITIIVYKLLSVCDSPTQNSTDAWVWDGFRKSANASFGKSLETAAADLLDRPFCERDLMFCTWFFFFCQLTFSDVHQPTFAKLFHMTWLQPYRKRCYADFLKVPPNKNERWKTRNFASNHNILNAVTRDVEGK